MKIAMINTPLLGRSGAERQILSLAIGLQKIGNEVEIFTPAVNEKTCYPELLKQVTVNALSRKYFVPFMQPSNSLSHSSNIGEITATKNLIGKIAVNQFYKIGLPAMINVGRMIPKGFDIINNHNAPTEWAAFIAKNRLKIPVVWMCNEPPFFYFEPPGRGIRKKLTLEPLLKMWDKTSVRYIDEILVLSHAAEGLVKNVYSRSSIVVRTGLDIAKFQNVSGDQVRKKYGLENDFVLLQVANLAPIRSPVKRQYDSIKALYYLSKNYRNVKLILDGAGPQEELRKLSEKLGLKDKVLFLYSKCDQELVQLYAACDVFIFPSQITWGLAVIEAMASSKPVIVSKGCGVSEIIEDNTNGMLVDIAKPEDIARKIEILFNDSSLRKKIGENAYKYVKENLSWEKFSEHMNTIFKKAILKY
ncbi:MAG: glycosyltransferase family 4 protein [Candidatus Bathyarchaeia archaeon]|jgi:glycosyltransferase involved in cell wall biosynthesis